ncbi:MULTISPECIES: heme-copper oxidase subunit III [unclassified Haladaptatus]|uniref:cytochrome c oxidase subunit 3 n=1 Tax=unclassified Haladaptatus TaxID=2622732 RepID=UPI0023E84CD6|nr:MULTISPECIES: heme-copper oxidase subunit III [unclassified Haladaptatus]
MSVEDASDDHGGHHHLPAVEDWPRGFGEASWWPFITALGGAGLYTGAGLFVLGRGEDALVDPMAGPAVFIASTFLFLAGLYGWLYHAFVVNFWEGGSHSKGLRLGMVTFLGSEVATFGAGFVYYFFIRAGAWPPEHIPHGFLGALVIGNTILLILSSITLHYSHVALRKGNRTRFIQLLAATLLLGIVFLFGQVYEYYEFIVVEGFTLTEGVFASAFFGLTGLHGLHVSMGAVLLGIVFVRALKGQYSAERHVSVSTASMYWHFVDAVWVFLVVVLYVGAVYSL